MKIEFELKPCPFCGERGYIAFDERYECPCVSIRCFHCGASTAVADLRNAFDVETAIDYAAEFWNQRA